MKHSSTRDLYGYWDRQRGAHTAPERAEIDPTAIPRVLADTFLLGVDAAGEIVFRLAGTRVCALFCREIKGETFADLFGCAGHGSIRDLLGIVCDEPAATVATVTAHLGDGTSADLELLLLPLRHHGRTDARILGVLAPIAAPYWLGAIPVATLSLNALQYVTLAGELAAASLQPAFRSGRPSHGLIAHDGGRR